MFSLTVQGVVPFTFYITEVSKVKLCQAKCEFLPESLNDVML